GDIRQDRLDDARAVGAVDQELHGGEQRLVFGEDFGEDVDAGSLIGGNDELAARVMLELIDGVLGAATQVEHLLGVPAKDLAGGGKGDTAAEALEEGGEQVLLEMVSLGADGRLRAVAGCGG